MINLEFSETMPQHTMQISSGEVMLEKGWEHAISVAENGIAVENLISKTGWTGILTGMAAIVMTVF